MQKTQVNPWTWQDRAGFSQAWKVDDARTVIFVSGQVSISAEGQPLHAGDFEGQVRQCFENMRTVLEAAEASLDHVVKLGVFMLDITRLVDFGRIQSEFFSGAQPAATALGVTALALPDLMIEVEATAVI
ncbi:MAG: RidA family protein [Chloroflexota bacterium]